MLRYLLHLLFTTYTLILFARIGISFFPSLNSNRFAHFLRFYTDPYLNIFRRFIPPIGGTLDLSPMLGFLALRYIERFLVSMV